METDAETLKNQGNDSFKEKNYKEAISFYSQAIGMFSPNPNQLTLPLELEEQDSFFLNRASAYIALNKFQEAYKDSKKALELNPDYMKAAHRLFISCMKLGYTEEAKGVLERFIPKHPDEKLFKEDLRMLADYQNIVRMIEQAVGRKDWRQAVFQSRQALQLCPQGETLILNNLEYMLNNNSIISAHKYSQDIFDKYNHVPRFLYLKGMVYINQGNVDMARKFFSSVLKQDPDYVPAQKAFKNLKKAENMKKEAGDLFKAHKYQEANDMYSECLKLLAGNGHYNSPIYLNRAMTFSKMKKFEDALTDLNKAIELNDQYNKAFVKRAEIHKELEQFQEAVYDLDAAAKINPHEFNVGQLIKQAKRDLKVSLRKDYYKILNIGKQATSTEIKKGYHKQSLIWHPDKHATKSEEEQKVAEKNMKDILEAKSILTDPEKRERYDQGMDLEEIENGQSPFSQNANMDMSDLMRMFGGGGGGGGGGMGGGGFSFKMG